MNTHDIEGRKWLDIDGLKVHDLTELYEKYGQVVTVAHCSCLACVITSQTMRRVNVTAITQD
jgi:hypothetical protein